QVHAEGSLGAAVVAGQLPFGGGQRHGRGPGDHPGDLHLQAGAAIDAAAGAVGPDHVAGGDVGHVQADDEVPGRALEGALEQQGNAEASGGLGATAADAGGLDPAQDVQLRQSPQPGDEVGGEAGTEVV